MYYRSNESVKFIMKHCMNSGSSIIGKNMFYVCSQFDCNITKVFNSTVISSMSYMYLKVATTHFYHLALYNLVLGLTNI